jgi:hypothetical protein
MIGKGIYIYLLGCNCFCNGSARLFSHFLEGKFHKRAPMSDSTARNQWLVASQLTTQVEKIIRSTIRGLFFKTNTVSRKFTGIDTVFKKS